MPPTPKTPKATKPRTKATTPPAKPLVDLLPYQLDALWKVVGLMLWLWRRQAGKTTTLASCALKEMMEQPGRLVTYASASLSLGSELIVKEASLFHGALEKWAAMASAKGMMLDAGTEGMTFDDFCEVFQQQKLEIKVYHSKTSFSRTKIIAPNVATARGWSGTVMLDEIGFIRDFMELFEAVEPIMSRDPSFRMIMATTPPADDAHASYSLAVPPEGTVFTPNSRGHWYRSQAGILVQRVDVHDAWEAGVKLFDMETREVQTPEAARAKSLDRDAWDRNYALIFKAGGTSACSLALLQHAMAAGRDQCLYGEDSFPPGWRDNLGTGKIALGLDLATTTKEKSNPSSLAIAEQVGQQYVLRCIIRFKSDDPRKTEAIVREGLDLGADRRARRLSIDATNERFFASDLKAKLMGLCITELVISSENTIYLGETLSMKTYLGNLVVNALEDGQLALPESRALREDFRLVKRDRGHFATDVDAAGNHGDTFDATKLALHGLITRSGPAQASAAKVGQFGAPAPATRWWKNPFASSAPKTQLNT